MYRNNKYVSWLFSVKEFFSFLFLRQQFLYVESYFTLVFTPYSQNKRNFLLKTDLRLV